MGMVCGHGGEDIRGAVAAPRRHAALLRLRPGRYGDWSFGRGWECTRAVGDDETDHEEERATLRAVADLPLKHRRSQRRRQLKASLKT